MSVRQTRDYYNEIDPHAAEWLRRLMAAGEIPPGDVDERDIRDVTPADLVGYRHCHFFAGIGGWAYAMRLCEWPDDVPVWTGSCPCQPYSVAGKQLGTNDERHLWPAFFDLIRERRPAIVFGEQVASKSALGWVDLVFSDLENAGYACGAADLCSAGVGGAHIRQRLYWMGDTGRPRAPSRLPETMEREVWDAEVDDYGGHRFARPSPRRPTPSGVADMPGERFDGGENTAGSNGGASTQDCSNFSRMEHAYGGDASPGRKERGGQHRLIKEDRRRPEGGPATGRTTYGLRSPTDWLFCRDGKWRPVEPGSFPLADGIPARVGRLRAYGNAIDPHVASAFMSAALDARVSP